MICANPLALVALARSELITRRNPSCVQDCGSMVWVGRWLQNVAGLHCSTSEPIHLSPILHSQPSLIAE
jgi:hypothetical protein